MSTFTNPVRYEDGVTRTNPDPFVMRHRGVYYCFSTGEWGVNVSTSRDLVTWTSSGTALTVPGRRHYWAPCVIYADGTFWMYWSDRPADSDDPHEEVLQVATSPTPQGPYTPRRRFFDTFSIDPHVVRDPSSGEYVMFYSTNGPAALSSEVAGTSILVDRLVSMDELAGSPRAVVVPTLEQEIFERNRFGDGRDWHTIEGATFLTHHDHAYLTYSGNAYTGTNYFIGYSRGHAGGPVAQIEWTKFPNDHEWGPLVRRSDDVEGTGHNSTVKAPNLVDEWIVYHGRDAADELDPTTEQRVMRIDRLFTDGDRLVTQAPTSTPTARPAAPTFTALHGGDGMGSEMRVVDGSLDADTDGVTTGGELRALAVHDRQVHSFVGECWVRATPTDAGARFGVVPVYQGKERYVAVLIDAAKGRVEVVQTRGGLTEVLAGRRLDVDVAAWQELRVERTFDLLEVWLAGVKVAAVRHDLRGPAHVGVISIATRAQFSALTVTEHLDLWGPRLRYLPEVACADQPTPLTDSCITALPARPLDLVVPRLSQVEIALDVEVHAGAGSAVVSVAPRDLPDDDVAGSRVELARIEHRHGRTTVRVHLDGDVATRVGRELWPTQSPGAGLYDLHLQLAGASLHGISLLSQPNDD